MTKQRFKKTVTIRLYSDDWAHLEYFAQGRGITTSAVVRQIVHKILKEKKLTSIFN